MKDFDAELQPFRVLLALSVAAAIVQTYARVKIPAVVIKRSIVGKRAVEGLDVVERHLLEVHEANHDVRHLHAGVVDVVLDFDAIARCLQNAHEGVAQDSVAHVPDVGGFVGINAGVLNHQLARVV